MTKLKSEIREFLTFVAGSVMKMERVDRLTVAAYGVAIAALAAPIALILGFAFSVFSIKGAGGESLTSSVMGLLIFSSLLLTAYARCVNRAPIKTLHLKGVLAVLFVLFMVLPAAVLLVPGLFPILIWLAGPSLLLMVLIFSLVIGWLLINLYRYLSLRPPLLLLRSKPGGWVGKWLLAMLLALTDVLLVSMLPKGIFGSNAFIGAFGAVDVVAVPLFWTNWLVVCWRLVTSTGVDHFIQAADRLVLFIWCGLLVIALGCSLLVSLFFGVISGVGLHFLVLIGFVKLNSAFIRVFFKGQSFFSGVVCSVGKG